MDELYMLRIDENQILTKSACASLDLYIFCGLQDTSGKRVPRWTCQCISENAYLAKSIDAFEAAK